MKAKHLSSLIGAGLLVCASVASAGNTIITFSVDMTYQVQNGTFLPGTDQVSVHGTFNSWGAGLTLAPEANDTNVYSGTLTNTGDANPSLMQYKFVNSDASYPNGGYETTADNGNNRLFVLPATSGQSVVLPTVFFADQGVELGDGVTNLVTFQVDMAQQINEGNFTPGSSTVEVQGLLNGWSNTEGILSPDPTILRTNANGLVSSNVYVGTFPTVASSPGQNSDYKFVIGTSVYESLSGSILAENPYNNYNRFFTISGTNNASVTNPIVFFSDAPYAPVSTNYVLFQVDMTTEIRRGLFVPGVDTIEIQSSFCGWGTSSNNPLVLTANLSGSNPNIYTNSFTFVQGIGSAEQQYKFYNTDPAQPNGGYEQPASGQNRVYTQVKGPNVVLPPVYYSDIAPMDYLPETNVLVTFTVDMTGAYESGTSTQFDPTADYVYINGDFIYLGENDWDNGLWDTADLASYELTNINPPGSNYAITVAMPATAGAGNLELNYNYGIYDGSNGGDVANEGSGNHTRWIRTTKAGSYTLPTDTFGSNVAEPFAFGMLTNVPSGSWTAPAGTVAIGWLGVPNVHLQASTNPAGPTWIDLPATDGTNWTAGYLSPNGFVSVTNWPLSNPQHYFRLVQPYIAP
jgi:hypothetical protein